jgi:biotin carboxyl carrier protein
MTCDLETGGVRRTIEFRRRGAKWEMTLDGRILNVNVSASGDRWSLLIGPPKGGPYGTYDVAVDRRSNGERIVHVNGVAIPVSIVDPRTRLANRRGDVPAETGPRSIRSPMPGRIVKVLVKAGDAVEATQALVVVEAMKMENELRAPRAGRVSAVKVVDGMSVEANTVLVTLE